MVIQYFGEQAFKISFGDTTLAVNPISKASKHKSKRFGADIALVSANLPDYNGVEETAYGDRTPFIIDGPGEYDVSGVTVKGIPAGMVEGVPNTVFVITLEQMRICVLGALTEKLSGNALERIDTVDILIVPVHSGLLGPKDAHAQSVVLEANIIIPCTTEGTEGETAMKQFLKEEGGNGVKPVDKLTVRAKDVSGKSGDIVVLKRL